jgi:uncharacterized membrane protein
MTGMKQAIITEITMAGFDNKHTVFLARAALARLQEELGMATDDMALIVRGVDGDLTVQQAVNRNSGKNGFSAFWETLVDLIFAPLPSRFTDSGELSGQFAKIGIDPLFARPLARRFRLCESALLVRTANPLQREKVVGMLQGFNAELAHVPLETDK